MEDRPASAKVAAGSLTCFGGKRELDEDPLDCIRREVHEELGLSLGDDVRRVVDLFVDERLIAYFYEAPAPGRDAILVFEPGRNGVWLDLDDTAQAARVSPWHQVVLEAWRDGRVRADFVSGSSTAPDESLRA